MNDVRCLKYLLESKFGFGEREMLVLTDEDGGGGGGGRKGGGGDWGGIRRGLPTRKGIIDGMRWLVSGVREGDSLWFSFSGHGSQIRDTSGDEEDGWDETILPVDWKRNGVVVDDEIYEILVRGLPRGVRLTAVMDCCHSGTGMDLPYVHDGYSAGFGRLADGSGGGGGMGLSGLMGKLGGLSLGGGKLGGGKLGGVGGLAMGLAGGLLSEVVGGGKRKRRKGNVKIERPDENNGEVLLFSGCRDDQTSADTNALSGGATTGAMTYSLIESIEHGAYSDWHRYTYRGLLKTMRKKMVKAGMKQVPQFSSSHPFDLDSPFLL